MSDGRDVGRRKRMIRSRRSIWKRREGNCSLVLGEGLSLKTDWPAEFQALAAFSYFVRGVLPVPRVRVVRKGWVMRPAAMVAGRHCSRSLPFAAAPGLSGMPYQEV
jgi:hypothetical protein